MRSDSGEYPGNRMKFPALFLSLVSLSASVASAANIFQPGDFIIAIDTTGASQSNSPGAEGVASVFDGNPLTKYLNFGEERSGFIVTPSGGPSTVQSFAITTANDSPERDPASYSLFGTNSPIVSGVHSLGNAEPWTLISTGSLSLPTDRQTSGGFVDIVNGASFTSYRMVFDTVRNAAAANSMQIADIQFFSAAGGAGTSLLSAGNAAVPIDLDFNPPTSNFPAGEAPAFVIDGNIGTKYLNFGQAGSGFIITPQVGPSVISGFEIFTANDAPERDPAGYTIYGTNSAISSTQNSTGSAESWTLLQNGFLSLPTDRGVASGEIPVTGAGAFTSYKVVFDSVRNNGTANSMQIADIQFYGTVIPEPSAALLGLGALLPLMRRRR